jgi:hypothetical protein
LSSSAVNSLFGWLIPSSSAVYSLTMINLPEHKSHYLFFYTYLF